MLSINSHSTREAVFLGAETVRANEDTVDLGTEEWAGGVFWREDEDKMRLIAWRNTSMLKQGK